MNPAVSIMEIEDERPPTRGEDRSASNTSTYEVLFGAGEQTPPTCGDVCSAFDSTYELLFDADEKVHSDPQPKQRSTSESLVDEVREIANQLSKLLNNDDMGDQRLPGLKEKLKLLEWELEQYGKQPRARLGDPTDNHPEHDQPSSNITADTKDSVEEQQLSADEVLKLPKDLQLDDSTDDLQEYSQPSSNVTDDAQDSVEEQQLSADEILKLLKDLQLDSRSQDNGQTLDQPEHVRQSPPDHNQQPAGLEDPLYSIPTFPTAPTYLELATIKEARDFHEETACYHALQLVRHFKAYEENKWEYNDMRFEVQKPASDRVNKMTRLAEFVFAVLDDEEKDEDDEPVSPVSEDGEAFDVATAADIVYGRRWEPVGWDEGSRSRSPTGAHGLDIPEIIVTQHHDFQIPAIVVTEATDE